MSPAADPGPARNTRPLRNTLLLMVGSIGPLGYVPASGTVSVALAGIPLYWVMATRLSPVSYAAIVSVFTLLAMVLHHYGDRILGESDSRKLVWDELAGFFIAMFMVAPAWRAIVAGFLIERAIDIGKVPPAGAIDRKLHSGVGVVLDDVVAGVYTCAVLHVVTYLWPGVWQ